MAVWKEYKYTAQWDGKDTVYRPLLDIEIVNPDNGRAFKTKALVDSGTDNIFDSEVAEAIGINLNACETGTLQGLGKKTASRCDVRVCMEDPKMDEEVPVLFTDELPFSVLLGQKFFFHIFDIRFEKSKNIFFARRAATLKPKRLAR